MAIITKQAAFTVGSAAAVQVANPFGARVALYIQSYGGPEFPSNPTFWVSFGAVAVASACWQVTTGGVWVWGGDSFTGGYKAAASVCPTDYISIISQSGSAQGFIIEFSEQ